MVPDRGHGKRHQTELLQLEHNLAVGRAGQAPAGGLAVGGHGLVVEFVGRRSHLSGCLGPSGTPEAAYKGHAIKIRAGRKAADRLDH